MKYCFTFFIILIAGLKLSAAPYHADAVKGTLPVSKFADTPKTISAPKAISPGKTSEEVKTGTNSSFIVSLKVPTSTAVSVKPSMAVTKSDSLNSASLTVKPDAQPENFGPAPHATPADSAGFVNNILPNNQAMLQTYLPHTDNINPPALADQSDSVTFSVLELNKNKSNVQVFIPKNNALNLPALVNQADSMAMHLTDSLYQQAKIKTLDSLRLTAYMQHQDSIKIGRYRMMSDSVKLQLTNMGLDSLKGQLRLSKNEWFKGLIYTEIATRYLDFDTLSNSAARANYQNKALNYTMLALHQYSMFGDTTGLRTCFDYLARVYLAQKKYSQAKWFVLQSNTLSRAKKDVPNVIKSLIMLSSVKSEIGDYTLAMKDLDEATQLAVNNHFPKLESEVLRYYGMLYSRLKNYPKEEIVLKKRDSVEESIKKDEEAKLTASLSARDSTQTKKADSLQNKKKVTISNTRKLSKNNSSKKIASL